MKEKLFVACIIAISLIFSISGANAIIVSPPAKIIDFKPNLEYTFDFQVGNRGSTPENIVISAVGDLNGSITFSKKKATIMPDEWQTFTANVKMPANIEVPGIHQNRISVEEEMPASGSNMAGRVVIEMLVWIRVPYPGKYIEAKFEVPDGKTNEILTMKILVANRGKENINNVKAAIDIYDINEAKTARINTESVSLAVGEEKYLTAEWTPAISAGRYIAKAHLTYDQNFAELEKEFRIGELLISINNIFVNEEGITKNSIEKFLVEVESKWNELIKGAYIVLEVGNSTAVSTTKSETFDMSPWTARQISLYWDSTGYSTGKYAGKVIAYYESKTTSRDFQFEITETNLFKKIFTKDVLLAVLIIAVIVLILINAVQFVKKGKKKERANNLSSAKPAIKIKQNKLQKNLSLIPKKAAISKMNEAGKKNETSPSTDVHIIPPKRIDLSGASEQRNKET